ncbi:MAG: hypothetical protein KKA65_03430 [Nanoarchaeota archaeon]|nr:hypothetical protein [Nanoarchaeota archaeon]MBU4351974.1 hypothetical protein [Nanoarchaeota archaeon]MBU4456530.1 hypothetical protein [Nanoarchaeota archaeon]MCG2719333.1 hypothetical protein [Nanoarchaeota archaeon]
MKIDIDNLEKTYDKCIVNGLVREKATLDAELIKSLRKMAKAGLNFIKKESKSIKKNSLEWTFVFRDYYEVLRSLIEAFLLFDRVNIENHQCNNAYLCLKHPELELNWEFLETVRLKRNAINYRGQFLDYNDWSKMKLEFELHINKLMQEIDRKLK